MNQHEHFLQNSDKLILYMTENTPNPVSSISSCHKDVFSLPLEQIHPRMINAYAITDIERLAESIQRSGQLQPVIVKKEADNRYQLIAGERRYTAIKYLHDKFFAVGDTTKANLFSSVQAFIYDGISSEKEEQIYRDTNDYSRQMNTFQRIALLNPEQIQMRELHWQEEFVRHVYGETKVESWKNGNIMVRGTQRERSKLVHALLLKQNPDIDVSEKTIRNYLAFLDRCNEDLRLATLMGKISIHDAMAISWNSSSEQTDAVNSIGDEVFEDYVEEGRLLSGSSERKEARKHKPASKILKRYESKLSKLSKEYKKALTDLESQSELNSADKDLAKKLNDIIAAIDTLQSE